MDTEQEGTVGTTMPPGGGGRFGGGGSDGAGEYLWSP